MKKLSFILAFLLLAGCSGMRSTSDSSGASGANSGRAGGSEPADTYRGGTN